MVYSIIDDQDFRKRKKEVMSYICTCNIACIAEKLSEITLEVVGVPGQI